MEREYSVKRFHTFHYKKLSNGTRPYKLIRMKFWLWGFGICIETKKLIWGMGINSKAVQPDTVANRRVEKK